MNIVDFPGYAEIIQKVDEAIKNNERDLFLTPMEVSLLQSSPDSEYRPSTVDEQETKNNLQFVGYLVYRNKKMRCYC